MMKFLIFNIFLISFSLASQSQYFKLKSLVNQYENSVIQEFSFSLPEKYQDEFNHKKQIKYGQMLEEKFDAQKALFFKAENALFELEQSLPERVKKGELTQEESDKLLTSVEYARRIILKTRKSEVNERYQEFKDRLSIKPDLIAIHKKFSEAKLPGKCEIVNPQLSSDQEELNFTIKGVDLAGEAVSTKYSIRKQHLELGMLSTRFDSNEHLGENEKIIINFTYPKEDNSLLRFSLYENSQGEFYYAEFFHDQAKRPWLNFFGLFNLGHSTIDKKIICNEEGRYPVSVSTNHLD